MKRVVSRENPAFRQLLRIAGSSRERRSQGVSLIEGIHLCRAYRDSGAQPVQVLVSDQGLANTEVQEILAGTRAPALQLAEPLFVLISQVAAPVGIAFLIETPHTPLPGRIDADAIYLDQLQDPGNLGTILRTCVAVGIGRVITAPRTVFCWSPKVLRSAMGAHFHLSIHEAVPWEDVRARVTVPIRAAVADAPVSLFRSDLRGPCLWLFGNEGSGLSIDDLAGIQAVSIPQSAQVESLNVGVAASVCLYEQYRQRNDG